MKRKEPFCRRKNPPPGKCHAYRCQNDALPGRALCAKHRHRRRRVFDPLGYFYDRMKGNAQRRGKEWRLTRKEWEAFVLKHGIFTADGKRVPGMTLDRKDNSKGYELGNLQALTLQQNSRKGAYERYYGPNPEPWGEYPAEF